jgi:pyrroloquinoline quinone biosynthesis protein D
MTSSLPAPPTVPLTGRPVLSRHVRMRFDRTRDRHVLLSPESVIVLNGTGADILGLCDGRRTVSEVAAELQARYDRVVEDEVTTFLSRLVTRRYVEIDDD